MTNIALICANSDCRIAQDGKCLEGYDNLSECPFHGRVSEECYEENEVDDDVVTNEFDGLHLPDALPLGSRRADRVLSILPSRMIGIIGVHDSGKTSVIAGVFDLFQTGPIEDITFAGSSTLHGLEMICHDARAASERDEPHSERTKRGEVKFYHIDVRRGNTLQTLLIADRSGEEYEEVADLAASATPMFELRRADIITVLVDGRRLSSPVDRAEVMGEIPLIIQGMVENRAFERKPNLAVVLTKNDDVIASPRRERVERDFQSIVEAISETFANNFGEFSSFVTSASPKDVGVQRGDGLAAVLDFWLRPPPEPREGRLRYRSGRMFDQLTAEGPENG